jgi:hypothetical protein
VEGEPMTLGLFPRADIDVVEALEVVRQELDRHDQNRPRLTWRSAA